MKITIIRSKTIDSAPHKLADTLSRNGFDVKLLVWERQHDALPIEMKGYRLESFRFPAPHDNAAVFLFQPVWYLYLFLYLLKDDADVVHAIDFDTLWPATLAKLIKKNRLYYSIYDFYANNFPARPAIPMNIIRKVFELAEKYGICFADTLFLTDEKRYEEVEGARINKLVYVYNTPVDLAGETALGITGRPYVEIFYAGAIAFDREEWLRAVLTVIEDMDGVRLVIAGKDHIGLMDTLSGKLKGKVEYLGWISHEEVLRRTLGTDILFRLSDPRFPKSKYESPYKVFEAMMSGRPIIVSSGTRASEIVEEERCGIPVKYGDVSSLKDAITKLRDDPELRRSLGQNGRRAYECKYSWAAMEKRLLEAYGVK